MPQMLTLAEQIKGISMYLVGQRKASLILMRSQCQTEPAKLINAKASFKHDS
jgi:hypothetical protein